MIIDGEEVKVEKSSIITYRRRPRRRYIPDDIWVDIFSRLPIKSLFKIRCVSKPWGNLFFTLESKINSDPLYVPLCGLFLISATTQEDYTYTYYCLTTKNKYSLREGSPENILIYPSGFESGLLSDLTFDFSIMQRLGGFSSIWFVSCANDGSLLLVFLADGSSQVHNPATKQIYSVPTTNMEKYGYEENRPDDRKLGVIIQVPSHLSEQNCRFIIVRIFISKKVMEVYSSSTRNWKRYRSLLGKKLWSSAVWSLQRYVSFVDSGVVSLYVLTEKGCGIAVKFEGSITSILFNMIEFCFPLPEVIEGHLSKAKIGQCEKSLYLSYYNDTGLWIWKAGSTQSDTWEWVTILEISNIRESCKPGAREFLSKSVRDPRYRVMVLAFHPHGAIVYLLVKYSIFTYNLNTDTLEKFTDVEDFDYKRLYCVAYTYQPCLKFMDPM